MGSSRQKSDDEPTCRRAIAHADDRSAAAGPHCIRQSGRFGWADGDTSTRTIFVELIDDSIAPIEQVSVQLMDVTGEPMFTNSIATISIAYGAPPSPQPVATSSEGGSSDRRLLRLLLSVLFCHTGKLVCYLSLRRRSGLAALTGSGAGLGSQAADRHVTALAQLLESFAFRFGVFKCSSCERPKARVVTQ